MLMNRLPLTISVCIRLYLIKKALQYLTTCMAVVKQSSMKKLTTFLCLTSLVAFGTTTTALAARKRHAVDTDQSGVQKTYSTSESSGLASDSPNSVMGKLELTAQGGTTIASSMTAGVVNVKTSYRLPLPTLLYSEVGLGSVFNTKRVIFPLDFGGRFDFRLADLPSLQPFVHFSIGPAFATAGQSVLFHMFTGPGVMYRMASYDLRFDMGLVMFSDQAGFQVTGGVTL